VPTLLSILCGKLRFACLYKPTGWATARLHGRQNSTVETNQI
jgi:hypothetical protein